MINLDSNDAHSYGDSRRKHPRSPMKERGPHGDDERRVKNMKQARDDKQSASESAEETAGNSAYPTTQEGEKEDDTDAGTPSRM